MDQQIKAVARALQIQYGLYLGISILLVVLHETNILPTGVYAGDANMEYLLETASILITIALVPLSLKIFSVKMEKVIKVTALENALKLYQRWSTVRLMIIAFVTFLNILIYYMTLNNIGALCGLIGVTASVFCLPGEKRLREELDIVTNKDINDKEE